MSSKNSFPLVLAWLKKAMILDLPLPQEPERGYICQKPPFYRTAILFLPDLRPWYGGECKTYGLSGLPNANANSQRFSNAISQIALLPPVVALRLNRSLNRKSQLDALCFVKPFPKSHWPLSFRASKSQRFKSQRLQDAKATKSQTPAFYKSQCFSATMRMGGEILPENTPTRKVCGPLWKSFWSVPSCTGCQTKEGSKTHFGKRSPFVRFSSPLFIPTSHSILSAWIEQHLHCYKHINDKFPWDFGCVILQRIHS